MTAPESCGNIFTPVLRRAYSLHLRLGVESVRHARAMAWFPIF